MDTSSVNKLNRFRATLDAIVAKDYNENHDPGNGRFTSGGSSSSGSAKSSKSTKNKHIASAKSGGVSESLSNFAWNTDLPYVKNADPDRRTEIVENIIREGGNDPAKVCKALNESEIGYTNWEPHRKTTNGFIIKSEDPYGNKHYITVTPENDN